MVPAIGRNRITGSGSLIGFVVVAISHTGNDQSGGSSHVSPEADRYPDVAFTIDEVGLMNADMEHQARAPETEWSEFYANEIVEHLPDPRRHHP